MVDAVASMRVAEVTFLVAVLVATIGEEVALAALLTINTDPQMATIRMHQIHINRTFPPLVVAVAHRAIEIGKLDTLFTLYKHVINCDYLQI